MLGPLSKHNKGRRMLTISTGQLAILEAGNWRQWVQRHADLLSEMLPDVAMMYPPEAFAQLVDGLLRRADLHGMAEQRETLAYCYGSISLGQGFESHPALPWVGAAMALTGAARTGALWDGFEAVAQAREAHAASGVGSGA